jgi:hypothetical protein
MIGMKQDMEYYDLASFVVAAWKNTAYASVPLVVVILVAVVVALT